MPLHNFSVLIAGKLYRCAQPDAEGYGTLRALNVSLIVKLNPETGSPEQEERYGFDVYAPHIKMLHRFLNRPTARHLITITDEIERSLQDGHVVAVHCQHGRDWTGAVCAAYRIRKQGWPLKKALEEFRSFGVNFFVGLYDNEIVDQLSALVVSDD